MLQTVCQVYDIQQVTDVLPCNGGLKVRFQSGLVATVAPEHPDHDLIRRNIEASLRWKRPVGILVDATGRIAELEYTYETTVRFVRDDERPDRLLVVFWAFSAACYLTRDHPDFERIRATLSEAARSGTTVVFANYMWPVEDETEIWNKILDVRPLPPLPPERSLNGAAQDSTASRYNQS